MAITPCQFLFASSTSIVGLLATVSRLALPPIRMFSISQSPTRPILRYLLLTGSRHPLIPPQCTLCPALKRVLEQSAAPNPGPSPGRRKPPLSYSPDPGFGSATPRPRPRSRTGFWSRRCLQANRRPASISWPTTHGGIMIILVRRTLPLYWLRVAIAPILSDSVEVSRSCRVGGADRPRRTSSSLAHFVHLTQTDPNPTRWLDQLSSTGITPSTIRPKLELSFMFPNYGETVARWPFYPVMCGTEPTFAPSPALLPPPVYPASQYRHA
ncbi:hypothetical protein C8Q77DRAFT_233306 [Trametes polyzona]|nr:hypothetical protein C8Q77DRAFT_233306 [Trametes polyzona]